MLHVTLYKYTNKPIIVDKTSLLINGLAMTGDAMASPQDMEAPDILLHFNSEPDYNYVYIQEYHRWYYVTLKQWVGGDAWMFKCAVDELYTYRATAKSISGIVAYSNSGSALRYDSRLAYNRAPTRLDVLPVSTWEKPGSIYVVMPTMYFASDPPNYVVSNCMRYYVFPLTTFYQFMKSYNRIAHSDTTSPPTDGKYEKIAVAIGKCIQGLYLVRWLDMTGQTQLLNAIKFDSPEINDNVDGHIGGFTMGLKDNPLIPGEPDYPYWMVTHETILNSVVLSWRYTNTAFWIRKSRRTVYIPYVGSMSLDVDNMGLGEVDDCYIGVQIRYDFSSNCYVVTPRDCTIAQGANYVGTLCKTATQRFPNQYTTPFVVDTSFSHANDIMSRQIAGSIASVVAACVTAYTSGGATLPSAVASTMASAVNLGVTQSELSYAQASSLVAQNTTNGGSIDNVFLTEDSNLEIVYPSAFMEIQTSYPSNDYASFWSDHGKPDGAYRSLATMTGYVQMQEFEMIYNSNATKGEMDRLEEQLYRGVIL